MRRGIVLGGVVLALLAGGPASATASTPARSLYRPAPLLTRARAEAMVVRVDARGGGSFESGTGFAVADGIVATAAHVTEGQALFVTGCDGTELVASGVQRSSTIDVAFVEVHGGPMLSAPLAVADPQAGDPVLLPGFPANSDLVVVAGIVHGYLEIDGIRMLAIDPAPAAGQSGSPVLDRDGRIAGVLFGVEEISGRGLAVPASLLREAAAELAPAIATDRGNSAFLPKHPVCP